MATLSKADRNLLSEDQQAQVAAYKKQYAAAQAAGDKAGMEAAHNGAEAVRGSAGYSGGTSGNSYDKSVATWKPYEGETEKKQAAGQGGQTADEVKAWVEDYDATNYKAGVGSTNGYGADMNARSKANYIRQQMQANSEAWHGADKATQDYLHQQNLALAEILEASTGLGPDNHTYDEKTGKWSTWSTNLGYGSNANWTQDNVYNSWRQYYGYTDADRQKWDADTSRYYNFVDTSVANRNKEDETSGYTGQYAKYINGPYATLMSGARGNTGINSGYGSTGLSDYSRQFAAYADNGVIQPNALTMTRPSAGQTGAYSGVDSGLGYVDASKNIDAAVASFTPGTTNYNAPLGEAGNALNAKNLRLVGMSKTPSSGSGNSYLDSMYDALLQSQLEQLKASYDQNISELDASIGTVNDSYTEQKRQADGQAAQDAANWRELAASWGLNSGSTGQAALAMNNQLQSDLNTLSAAQAAALTEIERQRTLLGQQYQSAINEAKANNDYERANALYQEAVRQQELLLQQQQYYTSLALQQQQYDSQLALQYAQLAADQAAAKAKATGGSGGTGSTLPALGSDAWYSYIRDQAEAQGTTPDMYILANYKDLGIPSGSVETMQEATADWISADGYSKVTLPELRNLITSNHSYTKQEKAALAKQYYDMGYLSDSALKQFLKENGIES